MLRVKKSILWIMSRTAIRSHNKVWSRVNILDDKVKVDYNGKALAFSYDSFLQLVNTYWMIKEQYIDQEYHGLDIRNRTVIDVGSNIGDSIIYFIMNGAKKVYAFEPYYYNIMKSAENLKINRVDRDKVELHNYAISGSSGTVHVREKKRTYANAQLRTESTGQVIEVKTLTQLDEMFGIIGSVLKMDCEGCEYDAILNTPVEILSKFHEMQIEYHYERKPLIDHLKKAGFEISYTHPRHSINFSARPRHMTIGFIYAVKRPMYVDIRMNNDSYIS